MKKYENLDNFREREHIIEVTLQLGEYKGKLRHQGIKGNCFGIDILSVIDDEMIYDIHHFECIDCDVKLIGEDDDGNTWFRVELKDDDGNETSFEDECRYFGRLIVGVNIVEVKIAD